MKKIIFAILLFTFFSETAFAQKSTKVSTSTLSTPNDKASFKKLFEDWNVGNLHIYSHPANTPDSDYYFKGKKINRTFQQYIPGSMKKAGSELYAVAAVRGKGLSEYYIVRINRNNKVNTLILFEMKNDVLKPKKTLAYFRKKGKRYHQLDSWMQDLNGNTRLDLIQKKRTLDATGQVKKETTKIFLRNLQGKFRSNKKINIEKDDYKMQAIL